MESTSTMVNENFLMEYSKTYLHEVIIKMYIIYNIYSLCIQIETFKIIFELE